MNFVNVENKKGQTRKITNGLARTQNTEIQIDGVLCSRCLSRYYRHDKGNFTTTIQSRMNEKKNNIIVLPFSHDGESKSC